MANFYKMKSGKYLEIREDEYAENPLDFAPVGELGKSACSYEMYDGRKQMYAEAYEKINFKTLYAISERINDYIVNNEMSKYTVARENDAAPNVVYLRDANGDCVYNDYCYEDDENLLEMAVLQYVAEYEIDSALEFANFDYYQGANKVRLDNILDYCEEKGIDISDIIQYTELKDPYDQNGQHLVFVEKADICPNYHAEPAKIELADVLETSIYQYDKYLSNEILAATLYDKNGEEIENRENFFSEKEVIDGYEYHENEIVIEELGEYDDIDECLDDLEISHEEEER